MESLPPPGVGGLNAHQKAPAFDAVILAGGRASRLGGYPKPQLVYEGVTLLDRALGAVGGAERVVVVGPRQHVPRSVGWARESPLFAGPVAALGAGVAALAPSIEGRGAPWVAVLAADLPRAGEAFAPLLAACALEPPADVVLAEDEGGRPQPLLALYRRAPLERALAALADDGGLADRPLRHLVARLSVQPLRLKPGLADDVDTWSSAERWGIPRPERPGAQSEYEEPEMPETDNDEILRAWCAELVEAFELDGLEVDIDAVLGLAGVAAHGVVRPAAPLTTFIAAYAAGFAAGSGQAGEKVAMESAIDVARRALKSRADRAGSGE
ncbi:NTP transferase domain-containing protein [Sinomonas terrae]|uniref:NTP transferase domain-containing protein n=1 Tax=Sinomonas terrae TaxID=2908838 RepID=A0ABS9U417_9MICC|nr:NTP transferase domain-containing protein [Sinomonas terrae]MCH6471436.1 NTP transferase domain-containing protein [Sinomonas terrae]